MEEHANDVRSNSGGWRKEIIRRVRVLAGLSVVATVLSFLENVHFIFGLAVHFRVQYAIGALVLAIVALALRDVRSLLVACLVVAFNGILVVSSTWMPDERPEVSSLEGPSLSVMVFNVYRDNTELETALTAIEAANPDVIGLLEVDSRWETKKFAPLLKAYPHHTIVAHDFNNFGLALLSRYPLHDTRVIPFDDEDYPALTAQVDVQGRTARLILAHPPPPVSSFCIELRNTQFTRLSELLREADPADEVLLIGDLNATPWSSPFRTLLSETKLSDTRQGQGIHATWPANVPAFLRIPLDHILISDGLAVVERSVGDGTTGSDHLEVLAKLQFVSK